MIHNFTIKHNKLFIGDISAEDLVAQYGSPLYVYDAAIIKERYADLVKNITYPHTKFHYACKQNTNIEIMKLLRKEGAFVEVMSETEVLAAYEAGFTAEEMIYTCSFISKEELQFVIKQNIMINLDSLTQIKRFGELNPGGRISIRINQGIGAGGHSHLITGGPESKFGIDISQLDDVKKMTKEFNLKIVGIHQHIGSNILDEKIFMKAIKTLLKTAKQFANLEFIDFGGGFGIPYKPHQKPLDMVLLGKLITKEIEKFVKEYGREIEIKFEPGRFLVGEAGVLLGTVTDVKKTPYKIFVGIDAGMNQLVRPAMYDSYHQIVNASNVVDEEEVISLVGNICESADFFARNRELSKCVEGDIIAILGAGASGYVMSSLYNGRPQAAEVLVTGTNSQLIREQREFDFAVATKKKLR
jgi:diaminopimelate decarboxylase